jgi:hypothetical protein
MTTSGGIESQRTDAPAIAASGGLPSSKGIAMNDSEVQLVSRTSKHKWRRHSVWIIIISATVLALLLLAWARQPVGPSPFFSGVVVKGIVGDPLEPILQRSLLRFVKDSEFNPGGAKILSRLASDLPATKVIGGGGERAGDGTGQWHSKQYRTIQCPPDVADQVMSDLLIWSEYVCAATGARVYPGGGSSEGTLLTSFSFRYEYANHQGTVWVTMKAPKSSAALTKATIRTRLDYDLHPDTFELRWDIRESVGPLRPRWVESADGRQNHWELELTGRLAPSDP